MSFDPVTPKIAVDIAIVRQRDILVIRRKFPPLGYALPGGFVEVGESLVHAAIRECAEETGISLNTNQMRPLGYLDDPARDPRRHVISFGFVAHITEDQAQKAAAADDAASLQWVNMFDYYKMQGIEFVMQHEIFVQRAAGIVLMV